MAKIPAAKIIQKDDELAKQPWVDKLLIPINQFMQAVISALSGNLTIEENLDGQISTIETNGKMPIFVKLMTNRRPRICMLGHVVNVDNQNDTFPVPVTIVWTTDTNGQLKVTNVTGLTLGTRYKLTLVILN